MSIQQILPARFLLLPGSLNLAFKYCHANCQCLKLSSPNILVDHHRPLSYHSLSLNFHGLNKCSQISRPRPHQRPGRLLMHAQSCNCTGILPYCPLLGTAEPKQSTTLLSNVYHARQPGRKLCLKPLRVACAGNNDLAVNLLIKHEADVNASNLK
ncbi:hypothetical protein BDR04DRAFT_1096769 [Suillus decipiens]|nr:hypothetical protein BDR04DRAFT_1096769 [Suillus decipiens]